MIFIDNPQKEDWKEILKRPMMETSKLLDLAGEVFDKIKDKGDAAVRDYEETFDKVRLGSLEVSGEEIEEACSLVSDDLKEAIIVAMSNIKKFHEEQRFSGKKVETSPGVFCWQKSVAIEKVGLYIPGGTAPLFSTVLMLAVPAKIAGCGEIVLCTPPSKNGKVHSAVLFAAHEAGVDRIFKIGGMQAIASMAIGTESVPKVYKIFGPGNQYVTAAKQLASLKDVAIDMPAGPSEVEVLADESANPVFVAADLLSQAEHGVDSQAVLVTTSAALREAVSKEVEKQLARLPRRDIAEKSLANSKLILSHDMDDAIELTNSYAPEHLIIQAKGYNDIAGRIVNAGSVFLGRYSCESAGDYASGTNHTLPTNGYAKAYNGVNLDSFCRKLTFQELTYEGLKKIGRAIETMAANEHLDAHKNAVTVRLSAEEGEYAQTFELDRLVRQNIKMLAPYSCARNEYNGVEASVFLDANENPFNAPYNRYPDPLQLELKNEISKNKGVKPSNIFCGNGSDEAIDLLYRIFCEPVYDNVVAIDPTYGMYQVCADINGVTYRKVTLDNNYSFLASRLLKAADCNTKMIFLCTPNNPTGNSLPHGEIEKLLTAFKGIVVVDEAYSDFSCQPSFLTKLEKYPNLVVLQTLSKAWGCAAIRLGMAFASEDIISLFNKVKYPYNVNVLTQKEALQALKNAERKEAWVKTLVMARSEVMEAVSRLSCVDQVYPSDANFFLVKVTDANGIYKYLVDKGIIVRNRNTVTMCGNCLRITIGTEEENMSLLDALKNYK